MELYIIARKQFMIDTSYVEKSFKRRDEDLPPVEGAMFGPFNGIDEAEKAYNTLLSLNKYADVAIYIRKIGSLNWYRFEKQDSGIWKTVRFGAIG